MPKKKITKREPLRLYGYIRVSTSEQAYNSMSPDMQKQRIKEFAKKRGFKLMEIFEDLGISGTKLNRPGLSQVLGHLEIEENSGLVVWKLDRLSRNTKHTLLLVDDYFVGTGRELFSLSENIDTKTAQGRFYLTDTANRAQYERDNTVERVNASIKFRREKGLVLGHIPYGWQRRKNSKVLIKNKGEQNVIRKMKRWRNEEGLTYKELAERLNKKGIEPHKKKAKWSDSSVWYILKRTLKEE